MSGFATDCPRPARQLRLPRTPTRTMPRLLSNSLSCFFLPKFGSCLLTSCPTIHSSREHLFAAKSVDYLFDHLDPEAGAAGWIDPSVDMSERLGHQIVLHRIAQRLQLEQLAGGRVERNRQTRR